MSFLLDDMWIHIVQYLSLNDILNLRPISIDINRIVYENCKLNVNIKTNKQGVTLMNIIKNVRLSINKYNSFSDNDILSLTNLVSLVIHPDNKMNNDITDYGLMNLSNLKSLMVSGNKITDGSIHQLIKLERLSIDQYCPITDESIRCLTNLIFLKLEFNTNISVNSLKYLTNLKILVLLEYNYYSKITDKIIGSLTGITHLDLCSKSITDKSISKLTNLKYLRFDNTNGITNYSIKYLTNLRSLVIYENNERISDESIKFLTNLQTLEFNNKYITYSSIKYLTNLNNLKIWYEHSISIDQNLRLRNTGINVIQLPKHY